MFDQGKIEKVAALKTEGWSPEKVLAEVMTALGSDVALASSFGPEDVALIHMMHGINPKFRVFSLDTGRLNQETYDVMDQIRDKYKINIEVLFPKLEAVEGMVREKGMNLFYQSIENRKLCCGIRKVEPLNRILSTLSGWVCGLRREQSPTRAEVAKIEIDGAHNKMIKVNPLADWTSEQVWSYVHKNRIPYNALHDKGYPSIGCAPCTRAIKPGEPERAGRWWWENPETKECGLHVK